MTLLEALTILEAAILECKKETSTRRKLRTRWICWSGLPLASSVTARGTATVKEPRALTGIFYPLSIRVPPYTVNPDYSGSIKVDLFGSQPIHFDFIIINRGKEIRSIQTDQGTVITGNLRQQ